MMSLQLRFCNFVSVVEDIRNGNQGYNELWIINITTLASLNGTHALWIYNEFRIWTAALTTSQELETLWPFMSISWGTWDSKHDVLNEFLCGVLVYYTGLVSDAATFICHSYSIWKSLECNSQCALRPKKIVNFFVTSFSATISWNLSWKLKVKILDLAL